MASSIKNKTGNKNNAQILDEYILHQEMQQEQDQNNPFDFNQHKDQLNGF